MKQTKAAAESMRIAITKVQQAPIILARDGEKITVPANPRQPITTQCAGISYSR